MPVYVKDPYEGFEVKAFPELTEAELDRYIEANVAAVRDVAAAAGGIDAALANHLVMGPAILARAEVGPFAAKIHGSALEYTVKPHPRFLPYAYEGMEAATGVLVGSSHTAESLWAALPNLPQLKEKTRLGPPGVDVEEFSPDGPTRGWRGGGGPPRRGGCGASEHRGGGPRDRTRGRNGRSLVVFVGKLIVSKGVDLLLAAWPLVRAAHPAVRLQVAGFGEYEEALRRLLAALERGDLGEAREIARRGWALEGGEEKPLPILSAFLADPPEGYADAARAMTGSVELIGRLEHDEVATLMTRAEAVVMPSTFPEAFGMVAVEAAACGALPVSAGHSGMLEVSRQLADCAAGGDRPPDLFHGRARCRRGDRRPPRRLAAAVAAGARSGSPDPGRDRRQALELGGSGPRRPRRFRRRAGGSAAPGLASAKRHLGRKTSRRRFNRMPAASCTAASR